MKVRQALMQPRLLQADLLKNGYQKLDSKQKVIKNQKYYLTKK